MNCTQPAPAAPGNQAPVQVPSLRRPPPANTPRTPRPINRRQAAKVPYPELPDSQGTPHADFWRVAFLRALAEERAGRDFWYRLKMPDRASTMFFSRAMYECERAIREDFGRWMSHTGGLTGPGFVTQ